MVEALYDLIIFSSYHCYVTPMEADTETEMGLKDNGNNVHS